MEWWYFNNGYWQQYRCVCELGFLFSLFKARSHGAIFSECDCIFTSNRSLTVWTVSLTSIQPIPCDVQKRSRTQKKLHRVNAPLGSIHTNLLALAMSAIVNAIVKISVWTEPYIWTIRGGTLYYILYFLLLNFKNHFMWKCRSTLKVFSHLTSFSPFY